MMAAAAMAGAQMGGSALSYFGQRSSNISNERMSRRQMEFQERMSSTAYQRAKADMLAAGINPILAYTQGGASSPGGASSTSQNPASGLPDGLSKAASSAIDVLKANTELKNLQAQNKVLESQAVLNQTSARKVNADAKLSENAEPKSSLISRPFRVANQIADTVQHTVLTPHSARKAKSWWESFDARMKEAHNRNSKFSVSDRFKKRGYYAK